jgi:uncharacterized protein YecT (DUF1311 family)
MAGRFGVLVVLVSVPGPAQALDCAKAESVIEKAICATPDLKALDDAMARAYDDVRRALKGRERQALLDSQRKWLATRDQCEDTTVAATAACLTEKTEERRKLLAGEPLSGPGTGSRMIPVFIQQEGSKTQYDVDFNLMRFAAARSPGEKLFNAEMDEMAKEAPTGPHGQDIDLELPLSSIASVTISYASPKLISAAIDSWSFDGGAHGNGGVGNLNIAPDTGRKLKSEELFDEAALISLKETCKAQILARKGEGGNAPYNAAEDSNYSEATILEKMKDLNGWSLFADKAIVTFNAYEIGAYAEGPYECQFPMTDLKKLAKQGAPLPE